MTRVVMIPLLFCLLINAGMPAEAVNYTVPGNQANIYNAIIASNAAGGSNTLTISANQTILGIFLNIVADLAISGSAPTITVNFNNLASRFIFADSPGVYSISNLTITGAPNSAVLSTLSSSVSTNNVTFIGNSAASGGAVNISSPLAPFTSTNNTFTNNTATTGGGGAIYNNGANVTLNPGNIFTGNKAGTAGGAIYHSNAGALLTINNNTFTNNTAASGGAIFNNGGTMSIANTSFNLNNSTGLAGAIYNSAGPVTISNSSFTNNTSVNSSGAIYNNLGALTITGSLFSTNKATAAGAQGGAIVNTAATNTTSTLTVTNSTFDTNTLAGATSLGGAIYNNSIAIINDSLFSNNAAANGGAIYNITNNLTINGGNEFTGNRAATFGGAIYNNGTTSISESSFSANTAASGGAIYNTGAATVLGGLFSNNSATTNGGAIFNTSTATITDSSFSANTSANGGAIFNSGATSSANIGNSSFSTNTSTANGGAIYNNLGTVTLNLGNTFTENQANTSGGAIYNTGAGAVLTINDNTFENNNAVSSGGAIYNTVSTNIADTAFNNNTSASGGAIFNNGALSLTGANIFTGNSSTLNGGALYNNASSTINGATFTQNSSVSGGAIYNEGLSATITDTTFNNNSGTNGGAIFNSNVITINGASSFDGNSSSNSGGAIYESGGSATINGGANFTNNSAVVNGGAIYNGGMLNLNSTAGDIEFAGNTAAGVPNDIFNADATRVINVNGTANNVIIGSGIKGVGIINKTNAGSFVLNGDSSLFTGTLNQSAGNILVGGGFFGGTNNITGGILTFADNSFLPQASLISLGTSGTLNITASTDLALNGANVSGSGIINKSGTGTLFLNGNDEPFIGTFNQTAGSTIVSETGRMFGGTNNITNSLLQVTGPPIYYTVNLGDNAILNNFATTINGGVISPSNIHFTGSNAIENFANAGSLSEPVLYNLVSKIDNGNTNFVNFNNSIVKTSTTDYLGSTIYSLTNSTLDLTSDAINNTQFSFLDTNNANISFDISFIDSGGGTVLTSDTLTVGTAGGDGSVGIDMIKVLDDQDRGLNLTYTAQVLNGLAFNSTINTINVATTVYEYLITSDVGGNTITLTVQNAADENSLYEQNMITGTRGFNISYFTDAPVIYNIGQSLGTTGAGTFIVQGFDGNPTHGVISGNIVDSSGQLTGERGSFFKLSEATDFTLANITVSDAFIDGNGSVLSLTNPAASATFNNVIIENNDSTGLGGAVYTNQGGVVLNRTVFSSNTAATGGAVYNSGGDIEIDASNFVQNSASGDGGALYNTDVANITGPTSFVDNSAGGNGGAIYNSGTLNFDSSAGNIEFSGNSADGAPNDIFNADGTINIAGVGTTSLEDGIAGTGAINKSGSGTLVLGGENSNYTGDFNQSGGTTTVTGTFFSGPGDVSLSGGSLLNLIGPNAFFSGTNNLSINNGTINTQNGAVQNHTIANQMIIGPGMANFAIDLDAFNAIADRYIITNGILGSGTINLSNLKVIGQAPTAREILFNVFSSPSISAAIDFTTTQQEITTPIYLYQLVSDGDGNFRLVRGGAGGGGNGGDVFNKQVFRGQVATMAAWNNQLVLNNFLFDHVHLESETLFASKNDNRYAAILPQLAPYQYNREGGGLWYKAFTTLETLAMTEGLNVRNYNYGSLVGADFEAVKLKHGWKMLPTAYIAYMGGHQFFNDVSMYQNGGEAGFMATFVKKNFLSSILAYGGGYGNEMQVDGTTDNTGNWFAGTAMKNAYNCRVTRHFTLQPTVMVAYNIFGNQQWGSDFGAVSMTSGLLNGINVAPGLNSIYQRDTWSFYTTAQYVFNINENINGSAGAVSLPNLKMRHGFIEYGFGMTKLFKERILTYFQLTFRHGGRSGVGFQAGLTWRF